jgi:hypothetical protein
MKEGQEPEYMQTKSDDEGLAAYAGTGGDLRVTSRSEKR